jgi:hypothetical protein
MARQRKLFITHAGALAHQLVRSLRPHGLIADFAHSYARQHSRTGVVDQPQRLRELESTLGREAVLVMVAEVYRQLPSILGARKGQPLDSEQTAFAQLFWPEFMTALGRALDWPPDEAASEREAFDRDLLMYRRWSERAPFPGTAVVSPFLDRCALLLDPSTMEDARRAAAGFERQLLGVAAHILNQLGRTDDARPRTPPKRRPARRGKKSAKKPKKSTKRRKR